MKKKLGPCGPRCDCIGKVNTLLRKEHPHLELFVGNMITVPLKKGEKRRIISVCVVPIRKREDFAGRVPPRQNIKHMTASFCPFCGKEYNL